MSSSGYPSPVRSTISPSPRLTLTPSSSNSLTAPASPSSPYTYSSPSSPYLHSPAFSPYGDDYLFAHEPSSPLPSYYLPPTSAPRSTSSPTSTSSSSTTSSQPRRGHSYSSSVSSTSGYTELSTPSPTDEDGEVWVTRDGRQVRYSSMHMNCATM